MNISPGDFLKNITIPFANTLCMMIAVFALKNVLTITMGNFLLLVAIGALVYLALTYMTDKLLKNNMISLIKESISLFIR